MNLVCRAQAWLNSAMAEETLAGYCEKKEEASPGCAACDVFAPEDIREEMIVQDSDDSFGSLCFRLFHRDPEARARWRRKFCKHFRES